MDRIDRMLHDNAQSNRNWQRTRQEMDRNRSAQQQRINMLSMLPRNEVFSNRARREALFNMEDQSSEVWRQTHDGTYTRQMQQERDNMTQEQRDRQDTQNLVNRAMAANAPTPPPMADM